MHHQTKTNIMNLLNLFKKKVKVESITGCTLTTKKLEGGVRISVNSTKLIMNPDFDKPFNKLGYV